MASSYNHETKSTSQLRAEVKHILVHIYELCHLPLYEEICHDDNFIKEKETIREKDGSKQSKQKRNLKSSEVRNKSKLIRIDHFISHSEISLQQYVEGISDEFHSFHV